MSYSPNFTCTTHRRPTTTIMTTTIDDVPPELVGIMLRFVRSPMLTVCRAVSSRWRHLAGALMLEASGLWPAAPASYHVAGHRYVKQFPSRTARCGWLSVLQWARANGCPWDESA